MAKNNVKYVLMYVKHTFSSTVTEEMFKINHKLNCDDKCLIYLFMCKCCGKQYFGETTGEFRFRWNNYKCNDRKYARNEDCFEEHYLDIFIVGNIQVSLKTSR